MGAVASLKRRVVSPVHHRLRFAKYGALRRLAKSKGRVETANGPIFYHAPNAKSFMRARTVYTKEPETIVWLDGMRSGDTYWDIGANIGIYTIYAGRIPGVEVLAFEPSPANFAALCQSVYLNRMDDHVSVYCMAMGDKVEIAPLNMKKVDVGFAGSVFGKTRSHTGKEFEPAFRQAMIGYTIDAFIEAFGAPVPTHLKIDVDGNDHLVLAGARKTLANPRLRSVLVELGGGEREVAGEALMAEAGFAIDEASRGFRSNRIFRRADAGPQPEPAKAEAETSHS